MLYFQIYIKRKHDYDVFIEITDYYRPEEFCTDNEKNI